MVTVLLFSPAYPPDSGGAATFYSSLVTELSSSHEVILITSYHRNQPIISTDENIRLFRVFPQIGILPVPFRVLFETVVLLLGTLVIGFSYQVDVIHAHGSSFSVLGIGIATLLNDTPVIYDCRDEGVRPWLIQVGSVQKWFSCSRNIDKILIEGGIPEDSIVRIPVVNPDYVSNYTAVDPDEGSARFEVVYVGELRELKGVQVLVEGFERFCRSRQNVCLTFVGKGEAREELEKLRQAYNLENRINFTGKVSHEEALEQIAKADVLVHPSSSEGLPRSITEAFELETPVVATPVGGIPDLVTDGETGLLIDRSPEAIHKALERLYREEELRRSLASKAKQEIDSRSWDGVSDKVVSAYIEVIN